MSRIIVLVYIGGLVTDWQQSI